jgi:hypothetical protein
LILAILKHGWIDQATSIRDIANDSDIKWGPPFEIQGDDCVPPPSTTKMDDSEELRSTAARAAAFINKNRELIEEYKGFNHAAVKRAYGLSLSSESDLNDTGNSKPEQQTWVVDESALLGSHAEANGSGSSGRQEPVDLPTAKDLLRRAKLLLARSNLVSTMALEPSRNVHPFVVLDQSDRCNILLAEMLRGLVKAKAAAKENKKLCTAAAQEASRRIESIKELMDRNPSQTKVLSKALSDMEQIGQHISLVQRNLQRSVRQFKNVLRVILGLEVDAGRNPEEALFPVEKAKLNFAATKKPGKDDKSKSPDKKQTKRESKPIAKPFLSLPRPSHTNMSAKTTGELAIENSQKSLSSRRNKRDQLLQLTEIEIRILTVACYKGLPVWSDDFERIVTGSVPAADGSSRKRPYALTWAEFGRCVAEHAKSLLNMQKTKVNRMEEDLKSRSTEKLKAPLRHKIREAEDVRDTRERAYEQSQDYASDPETLAKKTIMMLSKIRELSEDLLALASVSSSSARRRGAAIVRWLKDDLRRWGKSLDLLDDSGDIFALTAVDFLDDVEDEERSAIEVSSVFDHEGCLKVMEQVALMSRLRSIFLSCDRVAKQRVLEGAVREVEGSSEPWEGRPDWWGSRKGEEGESTLHHDQLLLERLMHSGFDVVLEDKKSYGVGGDVVRVVP